MGIKKYILLVVSCVITLQAECANPTLSGTNIFTGNNTYNTSNQIYSAGFQVSPGFWLNGVWITSIVPSVTNNNYFTNYFTNNFYFTNTFQSNYTLVAVSRVTTTNHYILDFGVSGADYATLSTSNNVAINGISNCTFGGLLSFNIYNSSGSNVNIAITNEFPLLNTNGCTIANNFVSLILTNKYEFRMTIQSNNTLSTTWQIYTPAF